MTHPHPRFIPKKPAGHITRGKTAFNRLRRVDNFILMYDPFLIRRKDGAYAEALFVDLGYGREPITTLESAERFRRLHPDLAVLGIEIDPERVAAAQVYADDNTFFRLGGFNLPLHKQPNGQLETVRLIRAFNVLRQYEEEAVSNAYEQLGQYVLPGGLLIEGTSDPFGRLWVANLMRRTVATSKKMWQQEALIFSTNFRTGFDPGDFQAVLPKNYIHRMIPDEPLYHFFQAWKQATLNTRAMQVWGLRQWFAASAHHLAQQGYKINLRRKWLSQGWLIVNFCTPNQIP